MSGTRFGVAHDCQFNMGEITVSDWVIVDEKGNDVSDWYTVKTTTYDLPDGTVYYRSHENGGDNVIHLYPNACDTTCNVEGSYDYTKHVNEACGYVQNSYCVGLHDYVHTYCGQVIRTAEHTEGSAASWSEGGPPTKRKAVSNLGLTRLLL